MISIPLGLFKQILSLTVLISDCTLPLGQLEGLTHWLFLLRRYPSSQRQRGKHWRLQNVGSGFSHVRSSQSINFLN